MIRLGNGDLSGSGSSLAGLETQTSAGIHSKRFIRVWVVNGAISVTVFPGVYFIEDGAGQGHSKGGEGELG